MIKPIGKYYLYRHIRLDKNEPFYIGIGTKNSRLTQNSHYSRAYSKHRSNLWDKVYNKTEYEVEILLESDDYDFVKQKEIEFITLYGRKNLETGILVNLTDGGDGSVGFIMPQESIDKRRSKLKGLYEGSNNPAAKKVINTLTLEIFECAKEAAIHYDISIKNFRRYVSGTRANPTYCVYLDRYEEGMVHEPEKARVVNQRVLNLKTGDIYNSTREASEILGISLKGIMQKASKNKGFMYLEPKKK